LGGGETFTLLSFPGKCIILHTCLSPKLNPVDLTEFKYSGWCTNHFWLCNKYKI